MHRLAPVLLVGGALLFASGVYAPASSGPAPERAPIAPTDDLAQVGSIMSEVNTEIDRLRGRLAAPPAAPAPDRDPFRFGRRAEPVAPIALDAVPAPEPVVELPRLVAVLETTGEAGAIVRRASFASGVEISIVKAGEPVGRFVVRAIDAESVLIEDSITLTVYRLSLR